MRYGSDSLPGILLAGHCAGSVGDSVGYADHATINIVKIGAIVDNGQWTYTCSHGGNCMHADAALASLKSGISTYHGGIGQGDTGPAIQPTAYWSGTWGDPTIYSPSANYGTAEGPFMVAADFTPGNEVVGQWVNKVGIQTGWTEGQITALNQDILTDAGNWIVGSGIAQASCYRGDSGAPVFMADDSIGSIDGNTPVDFDGMVFAGSDGATINGHFLFKKFIFSTQYNVRFQQLWPNYIYTHR